MLKHLKIGCVVLLFCLPLLFWGISLNNTKIHNLSKGNFFFDKTSDFRKTVANNSQTISTSSMAYAITDGIKKDDDEALNAIFTSENINADKIPIIAFTI